MIKSAIFALGCTGAALAIITAVRSQMKAREPLDYTREICYVPNRNDVKVVQSGKIKIVYPRPPENELQTQYLTAAETLVLELNAKLNDSAIIMYNFHLPLYDHGTVAKSGRGLTAGVLCLNGQNNICRNISFWFNPRIPPEIMAKMVVSNTLMDTPEMTRCAHSK